MEYEIYKDGELYHWGVRGMRWGVRRYQNKDGSLTDRGKKRLRAEQAKVREEEKTLKNRQAVKARLDRLEARKKAVEEGKKELDADKIKAKEERKAARDAKKAKKDDSKKSIKDMTDEELAKAIERSRLEQQYNQLNPEPPAKQSLMTKLKNDVIVPAAMNSGKRFLENALNKAAEKVLGDKVDPNSLEALKKTYDKLDVQNKIEKVKTEMDKRKSGKSDDDDLSWDDKIKKQTYERNKKKYEAEDAAEAAAKEAAAKQTTITKESPVPTKTSSPAVDAFINRVQNKPVSEVSSTKTRQRVQTKLESGDYDFKKWGRYDLDASRWDDDD